MQRAKLFVVDCFDPEPREFEAILCTTLKEYQEHVNKYADRDDWDFIADPYVLCYGGFDSRTCKCLKFEDETFAKRIDQLTHEDKREIARSIARAWGHARDYITDVWFEEQD